MLWEGLGGQGGEEGSGQHSRHLSGFWEEDGVRWRCCLFCLVAGRIRLMGCMQGKDGCPEAKGGWVGLGKRGCVREDTAS